MAGNKFLLSNNLSVHSKLFALSLFEIGQNCQPLTPPAPPHPKEEINVAFLFCYIVQQVQLDLICMKFDLENFLLTNKITAFSGRLVKFPSLCFVPTHCPGPYSDQNRSTFSAKHNYAGYQLHFVHVKWYFSW